MTLAQRVEKPVCRIGVFYDGSYVSYPRRFFRYERELGWLSFQSLHQLIERQVRSYDDGYSEYRVVYAAWFQGMFAVTEATPEQLRADRNLHHDLMHAGIEAKFHPMSQTQGEKGIDVALAVDALHVGLDGKMDVAALVTGDGDFVPLVRALMKEGIRTVAVYFEFTDKDGRPSFINERLLKAANHTLNVNALEGDRQSKELFEGLFWKPTT